MSVQVKTESAVASPSSATSANVKGASAIPFPARLPANAKFVRKTIRGGRKRLALVATTEVPAHSPVVILYGPDYWGGRKNCHGCSLSEALHIAQKVGDKDVADFLTSWLLTVAK